MSIFDGIKLFLFSSIKPLPSECSLNLRRQPHFWHPREMRGHEGGAPHFPPPVFNIWLSTFVPLAISVPPSWIRSSRLCSTHCLKNHVPSVISSLFCHIPLIISANFPPVIQIYPILLKKTSNLFRPLITAPSLLSWEISHISERIVYTHCLLISHSSHNPWKSGYGTTELRGRWPPIGVLCSSAHQSLRSTLWSSPLCSHLLWSPTPGWLPTFLSSLEQSSSLSFPDSHFKRWSLWRLSLGLLSCPFFPLYKISHSHIFPLSIQVSAAWECASPEHTCAADLTPPLGPPLQAGVYRSTHWHGVWGVRLRLQMKPLWREDKGGLVWGRRWTASTFPSVASAGGSGTSMPLRGSHLPLSPCVGCPSKGMTSEEAGSQPRQLLKLLAAGASLLTAFFPAREWRGILCTFPHLPQYLTDILTSEPKLDSLPQNLFFLQHACPLEIAHTLSPSSTPSQLPHQKPPYDSNAALCLHSNPHPISPQLWKYDSNTSLLALSSLEPFLYTQPEGISFQKPDLYYPLAWFPIAFWIKVKNPLMELQGPMWSGVYIPPDKVLATWGITEP